MMKFLLLLLFFTISIATNAQQNQESDATLYLRKSINKKKTGNILLISGGGLILTGIVVSASGDQNTNEFLPRNLLIGGSLLSVGILSALTSIPFYISANHNKKKYLQISPTATILPKNSDIQNENYALVGIEINF